MHFLFAMVTINGHQEEPQKRPYEVEAHQHRLNRLKLAHPFGSTERSVSSRGGEGEVCRSPQWGEVGVFERSLQKSGGETW